MTAIAPLPGAVESAKMLSEALLKLTYRLLELCRLGALDIDGRTLFWVKDGLEIHLVTCLDATSLTLSLPRGHARAATFMYGTQLQQPA